jgi:hypothetical protein
MVLCNLCIILNGNYWKPYKSFDKKQNIKKRRFDYVTTNHSFIVCEKYQKTFQSKEINKGNKIRVSLSYFEMNLLL